MHKPADRRCARRHGEKPVARCTDLTADMRSLFLWASRHYVGGCLHGAPEIELLKASIGDLPEQRMLADLASVWDSILATTTSKLTLHSPACDDVSEHEQALLTALRFLRNGEHHLYQSTMLAIVPVAAARIMAPDMWRLADSLWCLDARRHRQTHTSVRHPDQTQPGSDLVH